MSVSDEQRYCYAVGTEAMPACTWHGPIQLSGRKDMAGGDELDNRCCPKCGCSLEAAPNECNFWARMRASENGSYEAISMLQWSQGKCFPDCDTMINAYRQAMEGQS